MDEVALTTTLTKTDGPPMAAALDELSAAIERADELSARLVGKIDPVLTPREGRDDAAMLADPQAPRAALVTAVRERASAIRSVADRLQDAIDRVEV